MVLFTTYASHLPYKYPKDYLGLTHLKTLIVESLRESRVRAWGKQSFGALLGDASGGGWNLEMKKEEIFNFIQA